MRRPSTKSATPAQVTRDELLRATVRVVAGEGLPRLTLDAVARAAGVSKGDCCTTSQPRRRSSGR
ncbi:TetR family transcriptional regulator [Chloracidobacterium sp. 2]|nr:TetR family transcriptional regulator [Chloracidobacterium sp. 2]